MGLVTCCEIHFLPAPGSSHRGCGVRQCLVVLQHRLFHKPITTFLVSRWIHFSACRTPLIGFNNWLNTVNAIKSLAALSPGASRINQFLGAGCALTPPFSTQQSKSQAPQQHLSRWFSWLLDFSCCGCLLCMSQPHGQTIGWGFFCLLCVSIWFYPGF